LLRVSDETGGKQESINHQVVALKSMELNYLGQNIPNPTDEQCSIPCYIETSVTHAEIIFRDELGSEGSRVASGGRGMGQVTVLSSGLAAGI
jgi:hypothetical protein